MAELSDFFSSGGVGYTYFDDGGNVNRNIAKTDRVTNVVAWGEYGNVTLNTGGFAIGDVVIFRRNNTPEGEVSVLNTNDASQILVPDGTSDLSHTFTGNITLNIVKISATEWQVTGVHS